jgi:anti-sigma factor RsiW
MTCNEFEEILPDYLQESGDDRQRSIVEKHMAECAECRESYALWSKLVTLPDVQPSSSLRTRFETMLNAYEEGRWEHDKLKEQRRALVPTGMPSGFGGWFRMPAMQFGLAAAMLVAGLLIGHNTAPKATTEADQIAAMRQELSATKQLVVLSMLQQESASERLQGVSYSMQVNHPDPQIVAAAPAGTCGCEPAAPPVRRSPTKSIVARATHGPSAPGVSSPTAIQQSHVSLEKRQSAETD